MMRMIFAAAALAPLAACDDGGVVDQTLQRGARQGAVEACAGWIPQSDVAMAVGLDSRELCACAVDEVLQAENASELAALRPGSAELGAAVARCIGETQSGSEGPEPG